MRILKTYLAVLVVVLALLLQVSCTAQPRSEQAEEVAAKRGKAVWTFDKDKVGEVPAGWRPAETNGRGTPGLWKVVRDDTAPTSPNVVALTRTENSGHTFNLLIAEGTKFKDVKISVMVKPGTGKEDQGGGPIWRAKDEKNYYIARWNPLEDNFRVYYVKNSRRRMIGTARVKIDPKKWHKIEILHVGTKIRASLDGKKFIEIEDGTFSNPGMVGLWTKADAASFFDNLEVEEVKQNPGK